MTRMVCLALSLSLLFVFSFTACAALCMRMQHSGAAGTAPVQTEATTAHHVTSPRTAAVAAQSDIPHSDRACCIERHSTSKAIAPAHRLLAGDATAASFRVEVTPFRGGYVPAGWFDPALEKPDHLTPSLTPLSISRT
ncbi:hypothetical protein ASPU41_02210 [Arthrobacter sp. U41]|nr:hypothetical protein ASPU41_02210 [Arthrobacter sp. U41]